MKYDVKDDHEIEIMYKHDCLSDEYTMVDLAYIYSWRRVSYSSSNWSSNQLSFRCLYFSNYRASVITWLLAVQFDPTSW
jgi:hypothetical protein